jgi:hypothetical protein
MVIDAISKVVTGLQFSQTVMVISQTANTLEVFARVDVPTYLLYQTVSVVDELDVVHKLTVTKIERRLITMTKKPPMLTGALFNIIATSPKFYYGSFLDIKKQMKIDDKLNNRYPFVALIWDKNNRKYGDNGVMDVDLRFILGMLTEQKLTTPERKVNFSLLGKLERDLINAINSGGGGILRHTYEFTNYDEPLLGTNNIMNDYVDAVFVETKIKYLENC